MFTGGRVKAFREGRRRFIVRLDEEKAAKHRRKEGIVTYFFTKYPKK
ncbi:MAG: hypothetical protein JRG73_11415 [Deltaproteobacteria bacterium]|nr:hypothetical protein [Deltaproteobacteria bacterium]